MCGILFVEGQVKQDDFLASFEKIHHRGPDMSRILDNELGTFGFHRLAIMDVTEHGMQPFIDSDSMAGCNGEIYNELALKTMFPNYPFQGHSDCEVLIPMYEKLGIEMAKYLDAEFAFVITDLKHKKVIAARDPIGIRPLFFGYQKESKKIAFASEAKALIDLCDQVKPFPIGTIYDDGTFIKYHDITKTSKETITDEALIKSRIREKLTLGVQKRMMSDVPVGYLLSGGLDSSLVCAIAARSSDKPLTTFAIGMENDAIDLKYAAQVAAHLHSDHHEIIMSSSEVLKALPEVIRMLETYDITTIRASLGMYLLCKGIKERSDIKVLLSGEISDELFGYKYTDFAPSAQAFQLESEKRLRELYEYDVLRADRCIAAWSLEARVPFGDLDFVSTVLAIDPSMKLNTRKMGKYWLRAAFEEGNYLPESILWRDKAAFSDAVGHSMVDGLKAQAELLYSDEAFKEGIKRYKEVTPITKEALWYRDLFEGFYPDQSHWISAYWMPNASWDGCAVNDPSARVLSNYGLSGV
jgi:asparagine synthase (glutamine-hydrolysing)